MITVKERIIFGDTTVKNKVGNVFRSCALAAQKSYVVI